MHRQLREIEGEFASATARLNTLAHRFSAADWRARPAAGGWSADECIAHLNLTAAAYLPLLDDALERARSTAGRPPARFRRDPVGWLVWKSVSPAMRWKASTISAFLPAEVRGREELIADFNRLQGNLLSRLHQADGLPIQKVKLVSPFSERARYSLFSAFEILSAHEHRHLGQAERALELSGTPVEVPRAASRG